ncbi:PREDICTED: palmitoyl-protein thioesterase 1-like [Amphimedon queenslandica]|uniref:Uncharacterized protein n=1 Tax=Amphimedon queenslandica TaxID=400682 RepID=A0A1X7TCY1_AMPQE|nr:PREDICTED: palmitoyl-protein thioesterase 1-like [Amphimedon queenslandica]|eukprot:XP_011407805.1 PREDICTED: palmitoyl-protein thioesterase 1-like [Amphimedon queenslandica]
MADFLFAALTIALFFSPPASSASEDDPVPLVIWSGMGDSCCYEYGAYQFKVVLERLIPGIYIKMVAFGKTPTEDSYNSFFLNSNKQVELACDLLSSDEMLANGFNAMGFSQGSQFL